MAIIKVTTCIHAPAERCFDLSRSVDAHMKSTDNTGEKVVAGKMTGLMELGDEVTWEAKHFGFRQQLLSRITQFDRPLFFRDRMIRGAFAELEHDHHFESLHDGSTQMTDTLRFRAPIGPIGWIAEKLFLSRLMSNFLTHRGKILRRIAESDESKVYLPTTNPD